MVPRRKKLSKVLLFFLSFLFFSSLFFSFLFFSLVCTRQGVLLSSCQLATPTTSPTSSRHTTLASLLYSVERRCHFTGYPFLVSKRISPCSLGFTTHRSIHEYLFRLQKLQIECGIIVRQYGQYEMFALHGVG